MTKKPTPLTLAALAAAAILATTAPALAQVAGGTTTQATRTTESTQVASGWSVKKTLLGKAVYNDAGVRVGKVEDLIISPDRGVSYVIVGAGGFVGIGRHDVAVPVAQIRDQAGKLVMPGATKDSIKGMPVFNYASDDSRRDKVVAAAEADVAKGRTAMASLQKRADAAKGDAKAAMDRNLGVLEADLKSAEATIAEMKQAAAERWKSFEADVSAATARLRKSTDKAAG